MGSRRDGRHRNRDAVSGLHHDPMAVAMCRAAGVGGRPQLRIGGKPGPRSGPPLDFDVVVRALAETHGQTSVWGPAKTARRGGIRGGPVSDLDLAQRLGESLEELIGQFA
ncbi:MlrC C-terminal domain-containing protein [Phreatobacter sp.]|uniref:MlrC C-terminal domain-containing protein n=1 Tax=Phreatobacter sp. TaxID=1966341 RepID=UPI00345D6C7C